MLQIFQEVKVEKTVPRIALTNTPSPPRAQLPNVTKCHRANTIFPQKRGKFDAQAIAELNKHLDEGRKTILSQYTVTAPVVRRLGEALKLK